MSGWIDFKRITENEPTNFVLYTANFPCKWSTANKSESCEP